jgi:hypothetical protein
MRARFVVALAVCSVFALARPAMPHHSFYAEFDSEKPVTLRGKVTKVEWRNPHIWVYLDVIEGDKVTPWQCEGGAPNALTRQGWTRSTLKEGESIVVEGWRAKNGSESCNAKTWTLSDGKTVFAGSSINNATPAR